MMSFVLQCNSSANEFFLCVIPVRRYLIRHFSVVCIAGKESTGVKETIFKQGGSHVKTPAFLVHPKHQIMKKKKITGKCAQVPPAPVLSVVIYVPNQAALNFLFLSLK